MKYSNYWYIYRYRKQDTLVIETPFPKKARDKSSYVHHQKVNTKITLIVFFLAEDGEALYSQQKQYQEVIVAQIISSLLQSSGLNWRK